MGPWGPSGPSGLSTVAVGPGAFPASLEALASHCASTLVALDVRGCVQLGDERRTPELLVARLPRLVEFVLHTT